MNEELRELVAARIATLRQLHEVKESLRRLDKQILEVIKNSPEGSQFFSVNWRKLEARAIPKKGF